MNGMPQVVHVPISPENTALVFLDLVEQSVSSVGSISVAELRRNVDALANVGTILGLPMIVADFAGSDLLPEIRRHVTDDQCIRHSVINCWKDPTFVNRVVSLERKNLVMAGVAADVAVSLTAVSAMKAGFQVYVTVDCCGTITRRAEQAAWMRMAQAGVTLTSWFGFASEIGGDFSTLRGSQIRQLIGSSIARHDLDEKESAIQHELER